MGHGDFNDIADFVGRRAPGWHPAMQTSEMAVRCGRCGTPYANAARAGEPQRWKFAADARSDVSFPGPFGVRSTETMGDQTASAGSLLFRCKNSKCGGRAQRIGHGTWEKAKARARAAGRDYVLIPGDQHTPRRSSVHHVVSLAAQDRAEQKEAAPE